ncbi:hypothetical protein H2202_008927 [Exophiala xenobiotica]|nr:hypothetical protein H2202_008927 [Exophiala xenobiotica]
MSSLCRSFKKPNLNWETRTGLCPFHSQMCHERSRTLVFDTGYIDSHDDLGINANPKDRLRYRRNTTCAVLNGDGRINGWDGQIVNSSSLRPAPQEAHAYYGPSLYKGTNWTYSYSNFASFYDNFTAQVTLPYQLDVEQAMAVTSPQYTESDFEPIPELVQEKADLALLFLSFTGMYLGPVDDPWYSAHHQQAFDTGLPFLNDRYARDEAISTLGCAVQHQFCMPNGNCTEFLGFDQVQNVDWFNTALTPFQNATFDRMLRAVAPSLMRQLLENLALTTTPLLASSESLSGTSGLVVSQALPNTQWEEELKFWHAIAMAQLQRTTVQWATGQIAPTPQYVHHEKNG